MIQFKFNKLVRNETLNRMKLKGVTTHHKLLNQIDYIAALKEKLIEEAHEVKDALTRKELISELADILEVFDALIQAHDISHDEVIAAKELIKESRGGFDKAVFMDTVHVPEDNEWVKYFRASPEKYPELKED